MARNLRGRTAVVLNSSCATTKIVSIGLVELGADICLLQKNLQDENAQTVNLRQEIIRLRRRCEVVYFDANNRFSIEQAIENIIDDFENIAIFVNIANIQLIGNTDSGALVDQHFSVVPFLIEARRFTNIEKIINIASVSCLRAGPTVPNLLAATAALNYSTRNLLRTWAPHNINVSAIGPVTNFLVPPRGRVPRRDQLRYPFCGGEWAPPAELREAVGTLVFGNLNGEKLLFGGGWYPRGFPRFPERIRLMPENIG